MSEFDYDVIVVGAGAGGLYAIHRFTEQGLNVLAIEGAANVGGVWYHNRYPGARVDIDSVDYAYHFSDELLEKWSWSERYATQPELQAYFEFVADMFNLREKIVFNTWVTGAQWDPARHRYDVDTTTDVRYTCRFLVMTTGNLTIPRDPDFPGLDRFEGQWVQTSRWPQDDVSLAGRRVAVFGTGSTAVQVIPEIAEQAEHLFVFQRTPHYAIPARNRLLTPAEQRPTTTAKERQEHLLTHPAGTPSIPLPNHLAADYTREEQIELLEKQWERGGQGMLGLFRDQSRNAVTSDMVSEFVRSKMRDVITDPDMLDSMLPLDYPIGVRRLPLGTNYYETFNRHNVTLVDLRRDPLVEITATGVKTEGAHHEVDLIVFAIGFVAFTAALDGANIRNEHGQAPTDLWVDGPHTLLGLMTPGFPNLFTPTGPGSPSVLTNLIIQNEFAIDWIGDLIDYTLSNNHQSVAAREDSATHWTQQSSEVSAGLLQNRGS